VFLIDTGMLSSYYPGGRASALEICGDGRFTADYMDQQTVLVGPGAAAQNAAPAPADAGKAPETPATVPSGGICAAAAAGK